MILLGFVCGALLVFLLVRPRLKDYDTLQTEAVRLRADLAAANVAIENYRKQLDGLDGRLTECFRLASLELFKENAQHFVQLAENTLKHYCDSEEKARCNHKEVIEKTLQPLKENLNAFNDKVSLFEMGHQKNEVLFREQVQQLNQIQSKLENELAHVFYSPNRRGEWGEMQLRRIVEIAGMKEYVDFDVQVSENKGKIRPDMVVHLPNERCIVVDAKTPQLNTKWEGNGTKSEIDEEVVLKTYCENVRKIVKKLGEKEYENHFSTSVDFVVLFFPGEWIFSRALQIDSDLIAYGCENNVVFATPTTLIALLKSISYGWRQNKMLDEVKSIATLGNELYERLVTLSNHFSSLRENLSCAVKSYNQLLGSFESRLLPAAKKLNAFSKKSTELNFPSMLDVNLKKEEN